MNALFLADEIVSLFLFYNGESGCCFEMIFE